MGLTTGQVLQNRYRIVALLGQGGMGAVYRVWDTRLNVPAALKEMVPQPGLDAQTLSQLRQQFEREANILARLRHPHLVRVTDFFEEGGNAYLVMDHVEGEGLDEWIAREGALDESQVLAWAEQLLSALAYCHGEGVLHRDIKPQNVIVTPKGEVVLVDFGLVKLWDPNDPHTKTVMRGMGTPEYAPPEQYDIGIGHTDPRSDIYSLGATLYHALTGQSPPTATQRIADRSAFQPPRQVNSLISPAVEAAVLKAAALQVADRFSTAEEMAAALKGEAAAPPKKQPTKVMPGSRVSAATKRRVPGWVWALGGLAILVMGIATAVGLVIALQGGLGGGRAAPGQPTPASLPTKQSPASPAPTQALTPRPTVARTSTPQPTDVPTPAPALLARSGTPVPRPAEPISPENADRVAPLARWGSGSVSQVAYSPDGALLAVASSLGIYLYDAGSMQEVRYIETDVRVVSIAFSPDGEMLASGMSDDLVHLWRVDDGSHLRTLEGHESHMVYSVAFSPDGTMVASGGWDETARLWRVSDGTPVHTLDGHDGRVYTVAFSPDGTMLATGSGYDDYRVRLWRVSDGSLVRVLEGHDDGVKCVAFSRDGMLLASAGDDRRIILWQVSDGALLRTLGGGARDPDISSVAFSPDTTLLASGGDGMLVKLWRISDGSIVHSLEHQYVGSVAFSPDGQSLASASETVVNLWRVSDGTLAFTLTAHTDKIGSIALSPDGTVIASAEVRRIQLWRVSDGTSLRMWEAEGVVSSLAFSPDGQTLAAGLENRDIQLWRVSDGNPLLTLEGHESRVTSVAFSPDGALLASGSRDGTVRLWRASDGTLSRAIEAHEKWVNAVAFSPDGTMVASASEDGAIKLWRAQGGGLVRTYVEHEGPVGCLAFSPDGSLLAWAGGNRLRVSHVADGTVLLVLEHRMSVRAVAFAPDGATLASGSSGDMYLWRVSDGHLLLETEEHRDWVTGLAFLPDGTLLASGSDDATIRLWGVLGE
jgi:WD40 repeat protein/tRNA A-37 threonylcarbamoyl transferase component Bud32